MTKKEALLKYTLRLADNASILGHRLGEWCGHGPVLEQDIAMTNIALDLIGQARNYYQYAAKLEAAGKTEDDYAYLRDPLDYYNLLLLEQPNGNFAHSIVRQYFFDIFHYLFLTALMSSKDKQLAAIAEKSIKEVTYHKKWSGDWILRLGDGTELSNEKMQTAINVLQTYVGELFLMDEVDEKEKLFRKLLVHPKIKNINGRGLMLAVNLGSPEYTLDVAKRCMEKGLVVFWQLYRNEYLRISPPLTLSFDEIREGCGIILEVLNED